MIASLPMYDRPSTRAANERLWQAMRAALGYGPEALTYGDPWDIWRSPELLFAQTCSLPYRMDLHRSVEMIATPVHDLDCPEGHYFSVLIGRDDPPGDNPVGGTVAVNSFDSHSGWAALPSGLAVHAKIVTGSHAASVRAVADGAADLAAIDAVTWGMLQRDGETKGVRVLATTPPTPALPFITAKGNDVAALRAALATAVEALSAADREALNLIGVTRIAEADYMRLPIPDEACQTP